MEMKKMVFVVRYNDEETEFDDFKEATIFAMETGLGFPDVIIIDFDKLPAKHICMFGNSV
jgi:predicted sulfurtransferase